MKKIAALLAVFSIVVAACGDAGLLSGLGDASQQFVYGDTTTTTTLVDDQGAEIPVGVVAAADVVWQNDRIEGEAIGEPSYVIAQVWGRGDRIERFIQASRAEVAAALPGITFPEYLPEPVGWITSQLVYDTASATLDAGTSAAFGMWQVEPYTVTEGRVAILRVGLAPTDTDPVRSEITAGVVDEGLNLSWTESRYRYELFCRVTLSEELCWRMAETAIPLNELLGGA